MKTKNILLLVFIFARIQVFFAEFLSVLILAMIQDQAMVSSKHFLVETEDKNLADNAEGPSVGWDRVRTPVKTINGVQTDGDDYWMGKK